MLDGVKGLGWAYQHSFEFANDVDTDEGACDVDAIEDVDGRRWHSFEFASSVGDMLMNLQHDGEF